MSADKSHPASTSQRGQTLRAPLPAFCLHHPSGSSQHLAQSHRLHVRPFARARLFRRRRFVDAHFQEQRKEHLSPAGFERQREDQYQSQPPPNDTAFRSVQSSLTMSILSKQSLRLIRIHSAKTQAGNALAAPEQTTSQCASLPASVSTERMPSERKGCVSAKTADTVTRPPT